MGNCDLVLCQAYRKYSNQAEIMLMRAEIGNELATGMGNGAWGMANEIGLSPCHSISKYFLAIIETL